MNNRCEWCGERDDNKVRHHYPIPISLGGKDTVVLCRNCHQFAHSAGGDSSNHRIRKITAYIRNEIRLKSLDVEYTKERGRLAVERADKMFRSSDFLKEVNGRITRIVSDDNLDEVRLKRRMAQELRELHSIWKIMVAAAMAEFDRGIDLSLEGVEDRTRERFQSKEQSLAIEQELQAKIQGLTSTQIWGALDKVAEMTPLQWLEEVKRYDALPLVELGGRGERK